MLKYDFASNTDALQSAFPMQTGHGVLDVLQDRFSAILNRTPTTASQVGIELEFPLCTLSGRAVLPGDNVVSHLAQVLELQVNSWSDRGEAMAASTADGAATIGYEYSRALLEITLAPARDCIALNRSLSAIYRAVNAALAELGMYLGDSGLHPQSWSRTAPPLPTPHYHAVDRFLKSGGHGRNFHTFTGFIASSQTHVDACALSAPVLIELYRRTAFVSALFLANSNAVFANTHHHIARDHLWSASMFGTLGGYSLRPEAETMQEVLQNEAQCSLFLARRGDTIWSFDPVSLAQLDDYPVVTAFSDRSGGLITTRLELTPEDGRLYRAYGHAVPTAYGTIEVRGDCLQPKDAMLAPAALAIGLSETAKSVIAYMKSACPKADPMRMRAKAARDGWTMTTDNLHYPLAEICQTTLEFAARGLELRGFGERALLDPLFDRAARQTNPAHQKQRREA